MNTRWSSCWFRKPKIASSLENHKQETLHTTSPSLPQFDSNKASDITQAIMSRQQQEHSQRGLKDFLVSRASPRGLVAVVRELCSSCEFTSSRLLSIKPSTPLSTPSLQFASLACNPVRCTDRTKSYLQHCNIGTRNPTAVFIQGTAVKATSHRRIGCNAGASTVMYCKSMAEARFMIFTPSAASTLLAWARPSSKSKAYPPEVLAQDSTSSSSGILVTQATHQAKGSFTMLLAAQLCRVEESVHSQPQSSSSNDHAWMCGLCDEDDTVSRLRVAYSGKQSATWRAKHATMNVTPRSESHF